MKDYTIESTLTRSVVERSLVDEVAQLLQHRTEEGLCWRGSLTDLTGPDRKHLTTAALSFI